MRELTFADNGTVAPGDENAPDLWELALDNLDIEVETRPWREMDEFEAPEQIWDETNALAQAEAEAEADKYKFDDETDEIGEAIYTGGYDYHRPRDRFDDQADELKIQNHTLVRKYRFKVTDILGVNGQLLGVDYLAVVLAACKAADEIADLAGNGEVCRVIAQASGWKGELPTRLSGFGVETFYRSAGALQTRVAEIKARKPKHSVIVMPDRRVVEPVPSQTPSRSKGAPVILVVPTQKPEGSDLFGRVKTPSGLAFRCVCGCGNLVLEKVAVVPPTSAMRDRQNGGRVGSKDLWRHAFGERCIRRFGRGFSLKEKMNKMMDEESKREAANRTLRPRFGDVIGHGGAFGGSGKGPTPGQLSHQAARAEADRQLRLKMQSAGRK
ncbi:hypothetical protein HZA87_04405 [Candidatus Uhrbacteria bacterium]|nr:hypothetical protein [Candidatus Uhrbacteria bacterium]